MKKVPRYQEDNLLEGTSLFLVFETGEWDRGYPEALRSACDPDARDEACIARELVCDFADPFAAEEDDEEFNTELVADHTADLREDQPDEFLAKAASYMRQSVKDLAVANELREITLLNARPGKPYVYDEEVARANRARELEKVVFSAIGREYENSPKTGLDKIAEDVYELGFVELKRARETIARFRSLSSEEFDLLLNDLHAFGRRAIAGVDTREPLRLALAARNAPVVRDDDNVELSFEDLMDNGGYINPAEEQLALLTRLVARLFRNAEEASEKSRRAWRAWAHLQNVY